MNVLAAIDLQAGAAVQLVGGRLEDERIRDPDIRGLARRWSRAFAGIHVVDLDAAIGTGANTAGIAAVIATATVPVQVGGGLRDDSAVDAAIAAGARRVVVGTRGVDDADWLDRTSRRYPNRIVLAADVRGRHLLRRGWTEVAALSPEALLDRLVDAPLAAVLVTDVSREGGMGGVDASLFAQLVRRSHRPIIAAGGISSLQDLHVLRDAGATAAVTGMALYTGAIDPDDVAHQFQRRDLLETYEMKR